MYAKDSKDLKKKVNKKLKIWQKKKQQQRQKTKNTPSYPQRQGQLYDIEKYA